LFLDAELVAKGLLSRATLIDAIAVAVYARTCFHRSLLDIIKRVLDLFYNWNIFAFILFVALLNRW
jgi:hypothetical protein